MSIQLRIRFFDKIRSKETHFNNYSHTIVTFVVESMSYTTPSGHYYKQNFAF